MIRETVNQANPGVSRMHISGHHCFFMPLTFLLARPWATTHGHFLQMGGFRVTMTEDEFYGLRGEELPRKDEDGSWIVYESSEKPIYTARACLRSGQLFEGVLTEDCLKALLRKGLISFPTVTREEINDKSKGDALSKGIASLQLVWFIVQIIARAVQGLAITELELTTAALAGLNSAMYLFWWSKPLDVQCPIVLQTKGAEKLLKDSEKDVQWEFSESEFSLRIHIIQVLHERAESAAELVNSLQRSFKELNSAIKKGIRGTSRSSGEESEGRPAESETQISSHPIPIEYGDQKTKENRTQRRENSAHFTWGWLLRQLQIFLLYAVGLLLVFVPYLVLYIVDFVLVIPTLAVLGQHVPFKILFGADEWAAIATMMFRSEGGEMKSLFGSFTAAGAQVSTH